MRRYGPFSIQLLVVFDCPEILRISCLFHTFGPPVVFQLNHLFYFRQFFTDAGLQEKLLTLLRLVLDVNYRVSLKQARKLQDAQAEKLTSLQANKLTSWQIYKFTSYGLGIPDICPFFSTDKIFGPIFLHAKTRKSRLNIFCDKRA